jgi:hypothetical protein
MIGEQLAKYKSFGEDLRKMQPGPTPRIQSSGGQRE